MTDEQIVDQACRALHGCGYAQLRNLRVYCDNGRVTLQGLLPTYYLKQLAQSVILTIEGVSEVDNDVTVVNGR